MRAVIIDDEVAVRNSANTLLNLYCPDIEIVGQAEGVKEGIELLGKEKPDIAFLDVEMPDGTGFDIVNALPDRQFAIIFITGHDGYAIRAFKLSAIDYLLKPIDPEELSRAVEKARTSLQLKSMTYETTALQDNLEKSASEKVVLKDGEKVYLIDVSDIMHCQSDNSYTHFYLHDGRKIMVSTTLKEYERMLEVSDFFRVHQSHLVNLHHIDHFDKRDGGRIILKNNVEIPVSHRKKEALLRRIQEL